MVVQQVAVVAVGVEYQMLQNLAVIVAGQAVALMIQMGQRYSEQELPVVLQTHWMKQSYLAGEVIQTDLWVKFDDKKESIDQHFLA